MNAICIVTSVFLFFFIKEALKYGKKWHKHSKYEQQTPCGHAAKAEHLFGRSIANTKVSFTLIGRYLCQPIGFDFTSVFGYPANMAELHVAIEMQAKS